MAVAGVAAAAAAGAESSGSGLGPGPALRSARFVMELEFVSLCADAGFVRSLAAQGLLAQPQFRRWLASLLATWSQPRYAAHLLHPLGLDALRLLAVDEAFAAALE